LFVFYAKVIFLVIYNFFYHHIRLSPC